MDTRKIIADLRRERNRIDEAIAALEAISTGGRRVGRPPAATSTTPRHRRHMSPAARKRMSAMMKARWAARKAQTK